MIPFPDSDAVEEWLAELDFESFWRETAIYDVALPDRETCEEHIAAGIVDRDTALYVLKGLARSQIVTDQNLKVRIDRPFSRIH